MTQNATAYFQVEESKRSNRAHEAETAAHNRATEQAERRKIEEQERHNRALEILEETRNYELARHNTASERLSQLGLDIQRSLGIGNIELGYANVAQSYAQLEELMRSHKASEAELSRSNRAKEKESIRHNYQTEFNTAWQNRAKVKYDYTALRTTDATTRRGQGINALGKGFGFRFELPSSAITNSSAIQNLLRTGTGSRTY